MRATLEFAMVCNSNVVLEKIDDFAEYSKLDVALLQLQVPAILCRTTVRCRGSKKICNMCDEAQIQCEIENYDKEELPENMMQLRAGWISPA